MTDPTAKPVQAAYEHNGRSVSPQAFYAIACDPRRTVAVEACAGAGKTWMLVSRIVRALLDGVDPQTGQLSVQPHEILAITFTKRAASEMRERLYQWLQEFSVAEPAARLQALRDRGVILPSDPIAQAALSTHLAQLYASLLGNGRQVQIRTFHSWFAALLRSAPLNLLQQMQLPANYELLEDDATAKALVWRRFYAALLAANDSDDTAETGQDSLQADYQAVVLDYGRSQTDKALQTALDKRTEFALADAQGVVEESVLPFSQQYPDFAGLPEPEDYLRAHPQRWQVLLDAARALGSAGAKTFVAKGVELEAALSRHDLDAAFAALLTDKNEPRKFSEKVAGLAQVRHAQDLVLRVLAVRAQHQAWLYQQRMTRLSRLLLQEFAALKRERGWVDMNDVERAAQRMLSDTQLSGWVQERLDARVKHLLIDEFQDTNPLQWQALRAWLSSYAGAGGQAPSVFMVGDPKQSIYRFRRAEPQVFKAAQAFIREGLGGDLLSCDHTRRNAPLVIATVNAVMQEALQADGYEGFRPHTTDATATGRVCKLPPIPRSAKEALDNGAVDNGAVPTGWRDSLTSPREIPEETLRTLEARQAAHWIASQLQARSPDDRQSDPQADQLAPRDVMVLSRKRAGLLPLQTELRHLNIAAQIGEKTDLIDCCEVQDVVALLDVLVSPQHDLSLARVLKSPIFGLGDEALVQLALAQRATPATWYELLQQSELLSPQGQPVAACLTRWKTWLDTLPPHDALQAIYTDADLLAQFARAAPATQREAVLANLRALLGVSLQTGGGRFATPYAFVRALKSGGVLAPAAVNPLAVRLLTIHGAKGLEAKLVLLLDTDTPERNADTMGVLVDWPGEAAWPSKFIFLVSESQPPACAQATLANELRERQREELNALYVALTRARQTLAISSIAPYRAAERSWWQRLQALADPVEVMPEAACVPSQPEAPGASAVSFLLKELPTAPHNVIPLDAALEQDPQMVDVPVDEALDLESRLGLAMHRLLEWGRVSAVNTAAAAQEFGLSLSQGQQAAERAQGILEGEGAWAWRADVVGWAGNEVSLIYQGETLRLDRLVQRRDGQQAGQWWVLDYKSALAPQHQPLLVQQLRHYQAAVQALYPQDLVKAAFLTPQGAVIALHDAPAEFE